MRVILKRVGEAARIIYMEDPIDQIWDIMGGDYDATKLAADCCIVYRKDNADLPYNTTVMAHHFRGNLIVAGCGEAGAEGIGTPEAAEDIARLLFGAVRDERGRLK